MPQTGTNRSTIIFSGIAGAAVLGGFVVLQKYKQAASETAKAAASEIERLATGSFTILQNGQTRVVRVRVPPTQMPGTPLPVLVLLHGFGDDAENIISKFESVKVLKEGLLEKYIVIAPQGQQNAWNILGDPKVRGKLPDVDFVAQAIDYVCARPNVDPQVCLFGFSDGAGLANRLLIESDDARIIRVVTDASQLNTLQFQNGDFRIGGPDNQYEQVKRTLVPRSILALQGGKDVVIPANGGKGNLDHLPAFLSNTDSIFQYARAYGYKGPQNSSEPTIPGSQDQVVRYTLDGQICLASYVMANAERGALSRNTGEVVNKFLLAGNDKCKHYNHSIW